MPVNGLIDPETQARALMGGNAMVPGVALTPAAAARADEERNAAKQRFDAALSDYLAWREKNKLEWESLTPQEQAMQIALGFVGGGIASIKPVIGMGKFATKTLPGGGTVRPPGPRPVKGIEAYHGSPHSFSRFDINKIGTGEGAQAYGHGLYFAEKPETAHVYKKNLSTYYALERLRHEHPRDRGLLAADLWNSGVELEKIDTALKTLEPKSTQVMRDEWIRQGQKTVDDLLAKGRMYRVNIRARPDEFLDWDKPLSQQSEKVKAFVEQRRQMGEFVPDWDAPGNWLLVAGKSEKPFALERQLRAAGIKGIRYLDQGSRAGGKGTSNYVVFDDKTIRILKKYGLAGLIGGGVAAGGDKAAQAKAKFEADLADYMRSKQ